MLLKAEAKSIFKVGANCKPLHTSDKSGRTRGAGTRHSDMVMVMVFIYRIFYMYIFKCGLPFK